VYPGSVSTWGIVGRYYIGTPLSSRSWLRAGGDVIVGTIDGVLPLSSALIKDRAALILSAVSHPIEPEWRAFAANRLAQGVSIFKNAIAGYAMICSPKQPGEDGYNLCVNLLTGAWTKITAWDIACSAEYAGQFYFGSSDGYIYVADTGGTDNGALYYGTFVGLPENLGSVAANKTALMARATFIYTTPFSARIGVAANYAVTLTSYPSAPFDNNTSLWDVAKWDEDVWAGSGSQVFQSQWVSVSGQGFVMAPVIQFTSGTNATPDVEIVSFDIEYETGGIVV
jgi:hypothetical protein